MHVAKKWFQWCALLVVVLGFVAVNPAEAALPKSMWGTAPKVAVLPVVNVANDDPAVTQIVLEKTVEAFRYPEFEMISDDVLLPVLTKLNYYEAAKNGPDKQLLEEIRKQSGVDMVVMFFVEEITQNTILGEEAVEESRVKARAMGVYSWKQPVSLSADREERADYAVVGDKGAINLFKRTINKFVGELKKI